MKNKAHGLKQGKSGIGWHGLMVTILVLALAGAMLIPHGVNASTPVTPIRELPDTVQAGETFEVTVTFTAPVDNFHSIGVTDFAPEGWEVMVERAWCTPGADTAVATDNKAEYSWILAPYPAGTDFTVVYKVTVPTDAAPGTYTFSGSVEYYVAGKHQPIASIGGDSQVTIPAIQYNLIISSTVGGSVTTPGEGPFSYDAGTVVDLVATPGTGYRFVNWTGNVGTIADINAASTAITMNADYSITANFQEIPVTYDLTIDSTVGGSVITPGEGTFSYDAGTVVTLVATPDAGWQFVNWTGDVADPGSATTTVTMDTDKTVTANFTVMPIKINEFVSHHADDQVEWIELYNPTDTEVDLTGWTIEDNQGILASLTGKTILAGGYLVLDKGVAFAFTLRNDGDVIILKSGATEVDRVAYGDFDDGDTADNAPAPGKGESAGRYPNGVDTGVDSDDFVVFTVPTPGVANVPSIAFSAAIYTVGEDEGSATITVNLSLLSTQTVRVDYTTRDGTATAPDDYTITSGTLEIIPNMVGPHVFHVPIVNDEIAEGNETIILELSKPHNATLGIPSTAVLTITDDDVVTVAFSAATYTIDEAGGSATITVNLSAPSTQNISVGYDTSDGTATAEADYTPAHDYVFFNPGETSKTFTVTILNDTLVEGDETVNLTLRIMTINVVLGTPHEAVLTIIDDEMPEVMFDSATYTVAEDGGNATITVVLSEGTLNTVTVEYATITDGTATAGADYTAVTETLTFNPNEISKTFIVPIIDDTDVEGNETINLALSKPSNAALGTPAAALLTITDDEMPEVMFESATYSVAEDGIAATITVVLSQGTRNTVTVEYATIADGTATTGDDYTAVVIESLTFDPGGPLTQTFTVPIVNDDIAEGNETINLELSNATNAGLGTPRQAVLTIRDDESWLFPWDRVALIAPYPIRGRDFLTGTVALADVKYDGPTDGWFQVLWFDENDGTWLAFYSGFTEGNTLTELRQGEFYYVVVSHPHTSLWTEGGW